MRQRWKEPSFTPGLIPINSPETRSHPRSVVVAPVATNSGPTAGLAPGFGDSYWRRASTEAPFEGEILKKITMFAAALVVIAAAAPASAQVVLEANGAHADDPWGGEVGIGYAVTVVPGLKVSPPSAR